MFQGSSSNLFKQKLNEFKVTLTTLITLKKLRIINFKIVRDH